jgi:hypothetical protein
VISTPKSKATAIIGTIEKPKKKHKILTTISLFCLKMKDIATENVEDKMHIVKTAILYILVFSTHIPNTAEPTIPPTINSAPNTLGSLVE